VLLKPKQPHADTFAHYGIESLGLIAQALHYRRYFLLKDTLHYSRKESIAILIVTYDGQTSGATQNLSRNTTR
jgi:hypothetical protein